MSWRPPVFVFFFVWVIYGLFIKESDLVAYNLQQTGIDALVEHGTFRLGLSPHPLLQPRLDVFTFGDGRFAAKQPGQFSIGAVAYVPLRAGGLTYQKNYVSAAAWVTWLSASSFAALTASLLFYLMNQIWKLGRNPSLVATGAFAFGTPFFAYAGVAHHDVIATCFLFAAFVAFEKQRRADKNHAVFDERKSHRRSDFLSMLQGVLLGLTIFTSMLPALMVACLALAAGLLSIRTRRSHRLFFLFAGLAVGFAPLAWHNWHYFGSPFLQANAAGNYQDTFLRPSWELFSRHLYDYFGTGPVSIWLYAPIAMLGFAGLGMISVRPIPNLRAPVLLATSALLLHVAYILNIETFGHCQFGPRYLLPALPFLCFPIGVLWREATPASRVLIALTCGISFVIALTGALTGTMACNLRQWVPYVVWSQGLNLGNFPLLVWMAVGLALLLASVSGARLRTPQPGNRS